MNVGAEWRFWTFSLEYLVPILKCKACGALIDDPAAARPLHCPHCGTALYGAASLAPGTHRSAPVATDDRWLRGLLVRVYCRTLVVLMLYVLSTGPLYWAIHEAFNDNGSVFLARLYYPIALACEHSDAISNWFDWYIGLWIY